MENGFYLAVVGDHDEAEPIRVQDGFWFSTGCADPHDLGSVEIISPIRVEIAPKTVRLENSAWAKLREENYAEWSRQYVRRYGRKPGHKRWPSPTVKGEGE